MRRFQRTFLGGSAWALGLMLSLVTTAALAEPESADVRLLIDVSGSMKQNDPNNLRRPALRMMVGLMQPGTRAGVWTFAGGVEELVARGQVDEAWKAKGTHLSKRIGSPGQYTDIEGALRSAIADWRDSEPAYRRHVLLLTDGMVDVSKDASQSAASRQRILDQLLPELKAMSVHVHAVALSDRADHDLMKRLSSGTDGWYQKVDAAAQLQKSFLRIFEKAGKPDSLPLVGNRFEVDSSVREATVLVFRQEGARPTRLFAPDGTSFDGSDIAAGIAWRQDEGYDLITITEPAAGEWSLEADIDPDNRVMVVTDLKLKTTKLPNRVAVGEAVPVVVHLTNRGTLINQQAFLDLLSMRAEAVDTATDERIELPVNDRGERGDQRPKDGYFSARLRQTRAAEALELLVAVESETFVRQQRHVFSVIEPLTVALMAEQGDEPPRVHLLVAEAVVEPGAEIRAWQESDDSGVSELSLERIEDGGFQAPLIDTGMPLFARVLGKGHSGQVIERRYGPLYLAGFEPAAEPSIEPVVIENEPDQEEVADQASAEAEGVDTLTMALFIGGNVLLLLAAGGFWWWRRRRAVEEVQLLDDEEAGEPSDAPSNAKDSPEAEAKEDQAA